MYVIVYIFGIAQSVPPPGFMLSHLLLQTEIHLTRKGYKVQIISSKMKKREVLAWNENDAVAVDLAFFFIILWAFVTCALLINLCIMISLKFLVLTKQHFLGAATPKRRFVHGVCTCMFVKRFNEMKGVVICFPFLWSTRLFIVCLVLYVMCVWFAIISYNFFVVDKFVFVSKAKITNRLVLVLLRKTKFRYVIAFT